MENNKVEMFLMQHGDKFAATDLAKVRTTLEQMPDGEFYRISGSDWKNPTITLILALLAGAYGIGAFYVKKIGFGIAQVAIFVVYFMLAFGVGFLSGLTESGEDLLGFLIVVMVLFFGLMIAMIVMVIISAVKARSWTNEYNMQKFTQLTQF